MIDRVDLNMSTLGALSYGVGGLGNGGDVPDARALPAAGDRVHIDAVAEKSVAYSQAPPIIPNEQSAENANAQRAAMQPYLGGDIALDRGFAGFLPNYENPFRPNAQDIPTVEQSTGAILSMWA